MAKVYPFQHVIHAIHAIHTPFTHFARIADLTDIHIEHLEIMDYDSFAEVHEAPKLHYKYNLMIVEMPSICHLIHCLIGLKRVEVEVRVHENQLDISSQL